MHSVVIISAAKRSLDLDQIRSIVESRCICCSVSICIGRLRERAWLRISCLRAEHKVARIFEKSKLPT